MSADNQSGPIVTHTKGSLKSVTFDQGQTVIYREEGAKLGPPIAIVFTGRDRPDGETYSTLFLAAPELLKAGKRFAQAIHAECYDQDLLVDIYHDMRDAITKAEGAQS